MSVPGSKASRRRAIRLNVLHRKQKGTCLLCGERLRRPTFEHVVPVSAGGSNLDAHHAGGNVALYCRRCNAERGTLPLAPDQLARLAAWYPRAALLTVVVA